MQNHNFLVQAKLFEEARVLKLRAKLFQRWERQGLVVSRERFVVTYISIFFVYV